MTFWNISSQLFACRSYFSVSLFCHCRLLKTIHWSHEIWSLGAALYVFDHMLSLFLLTNMMTISNHYFKFLFTKYLCRSMFSAKQCALHITNVHDCTNLWDLSSFETSIDCQLWSNQTLIPFSPRHLYHPQLSINLFQLLRTIMMTTLMITTLMMTMLSTTTLTTMPTRTHRWPIGLVLS